jgi:hypothetical protein
MSPGESPFTPASKNPPSHDPRWSEGPSAGVTSHAGASPPEPGLGAPPAPPFPVTLTGSTFSSPQLQPENTVTTTIDKTSQDARAMA